MHSDDILDLIVGEREREIDEVNISGDVRGIYPKILFKRLVVPVVFRSRRRRKRATTNQPELLRVFKVPGTYTATATRSIYFARE